MSIPGTAPSALRQRVHTTREHLVRLRPFEVTGVAPPARWDPSAEALAVTYTINDPNERIRRGRIVYVATYNDEEVVLASRRLDREELTHGEHTLAEAQRWDGTIGSGIPARNGQRVTADLAPVGVRVEVWNTTHDEPARRVRGGNGRTEREGEWHSSRTAPVEIDAFVEARWSRNFVIPYNDPDEPDSGKVAMVIRTKNVLPDTSATVIVNRIVNINDPLEDVLYTDHLTQDATEQPGLHNLVVRNDRVVQQDGSDPEVRFNRRDQHWTTPGVSFYAFSVGFGDGWPMVASQRDYENHDRDCLNLRFTVFIRGNAYGSGPGQIYRMLRNSTRYYRPFLMQRDRPASANDWFHHMGFRFMVFTMCHGACWCEHTDHPSTGGTRNGVYHQGFTPDVNHCPLPGDIIDGARVQRLIAQDRRNYRENYGGCGHKSHVGHDIVIGRMARNAPAAGVRNKKIYWGNVPGRSERNALNFHIDGEPAGTSRQSGYYITTRGMPRFAFYNGGCRGMLTTNLAEHFTANGTRYYHGWVYSVWISESNRFARELLQRWILGTSDDRPNSEYDPDRFERVYTQLTRRSYVVSHARLMRGNSVINRAPSRAVPAGGPPGSAETALA